MVDHHYHRHPLQPEDLFPRLPTDVLLSGDEWEVRGRPGRRREQGSEETPTPTGTDLTTHPPHSAPRLRVTERTVGVGSDDRFLLGALEPVNPTHLFWEGDDERWTESRIPDVSGGGRGRPWSWY